MPELPAFCRRSQSGSEEPDLSEEEIALAEESHMRVIRAMTPAELLAFQWASEDGETELAQAALDAAARRLAAADRGASTSPKTPKRRRRHTNSPKTSS